MTERKSGWIPELDGLRALMIFIVSAYHIWQQSWLTPVFDLTGIGLGVWSMDYLLRTGYVWVDGTVLLSAFLLYLPYARVKENSAAIPDARGFYFRRARRVLPGYYFILALVLFAIALPWGLYSSPQFMVKDVATHLTFTFPFFYDTYVATNLGVACWTLAIEVQAYALHPWVARASLKKPVTTFGILLFLCFGFRLWCVWSLTEFNMVVNQLINFLDLYVLGSLMAIAFTRLRNRTEEKDLLWWQRTIATVIFFLAVWGLDVLLREQARSSTYTVNRGFAGWVSRVLGGAKSSGHYYVLQRNQMLYRPGFGILFGAMILSAPFTLKPLRLILGNRVTKFLSGISMNYYLIHQTVIVHMRRIGFPVSESDTPNQVGEQPWQTRYVIFAFLFSFLAAVLITYLVEKPAARLIDRRRQKKAASRMEAVNGGKEEED